MILPADLLSVQYVARNMCDMDAVEIFATRFGDDRDALAAEAAAMQHSYLYLSNDVPTTAFGVIEVWPGVWSVWMFSTDALEAKHGAPIIRHFKRVIAPLLLARGCHRVQCDSWEAHYTAHRFIKRFGGSEEAILRGYGRNGENFIRFCWDRASLRCQAAQLRPDGIQAISEPSNTGG